MYRLKRSEKATARLDRYDDKIYKRKRKKLREGLDVGERVYVLAGRIKLVILTKKQFTWLGREKRLIA